jgi:hypothetical protein
LRIKEFIDKANEKINRREMFYLEYFEEGKKLGCYKFSLCG